MKKAEIKALEKYPIEDGKMWTSAFGTFEFDRNAPERKAYQEGYKQAENDLIDRLAEFYPTLDYTFRSYMLQEFPELKRKIEHYD